MASIGIDLGTYNSAASYMLPDGKIVMLKAYHDTTYQGDVIPSFLKFFANGELEKYGEPARQELEITPHLVVWGIKRLIGQSYQMAVDKREIGENSRFGYPIEKAADGSIRIPLALNKIYTPTDIIKMLLQKIKTDCEASFNPINGTITKAVVTHPAYFDGIQIKSIKEALRKDEILKTGFDEFELLSEPEAAALAYKDIISFVDNQYVLVIDWGAGTLDMVTAKFHLENGMPKITNVSPAYGDNRLGGIDMDDALMKEAQRLYHFDEMNPKIKSVLRVEIEKAKIDLSNKPWSIKFFLYKGKNVRLKMAIDMESIPSGENTEDWILLESVLKEILAKFKKHLLHAVRELTPLGIDQLILVGGPMYMQSVRNVIKEAFNENENVLVQLKKIEEEGFPVSPLEAVARGAGIYASADRGRIKKDDSRNAYGYGYLVGITGEILICSGMKGGIEKQTKQPLSMLVLPGQEIPLSLLKEEDTSEGKKYYRRGDYTFNLVCGPLGTSFYPIVELDKDLIPILKIKDNNSPNPPLTLSLSSHHDILIPKPIPPAPGEGIIDSQPPPQGDIPVEQVERLHQESNSAVNFIESELKRGKILSHSTVDKSSKLIKKLNYLPHGAIPPKLHYLYQAVANSLTELRNSLTSNDGYLEEQLKL